MNQSVPRVFALFHPHTLTQRVDATQCSPGSEHIWCQGHTWTQISTKYICIYSKRQLSWVAFCVSLGSLSSHTEALVQYCCLKSPSFSPSPGDFLLSGERLLCGHNDKSVRLLVLFRQTVFFFFFFPCRLWQVVVSKASQKSPRFLLLQWISRSDLMTLWFLDRLPQWFWYSLQTNQMAKAKEEEKTNRNAESPVLS